MISISVLFICGEVADPCLKTDTTHVSAWMRGAAAHTNGTKTHIHLPHARGWAFGGSGGTENMSWGADTSIP